jgi:hypothetical protein
MSESVTNDFCPLRSIITNRPSVGVLRVAFTARYLSSESEGDKSSLPCPLPVNQNSSPSAASGNRSQCSAYLDLL